MEIVFSPEALLQLQYWKKSGNKRVTEKITQLLQKFKKRRSKELGNPRPLNINGLVTGQGE